MGNKEVVAVRNGNSKDAVGRVGNGAGLGNNATGIIRDVDVDRSSRQIDWSRVRVSAVHCEDLVLPFYNRIHELRFNRGGLDVKL